MSLGMSAVLTERVHAHLCRAYPEEGCGVLVGRDDGARRVVERVIPLENRRDDSRHNRYVISPEQILVAERVARDAGLDVVGFFHVNWFRKDGHGRFLWPGYGENSRVLKWVFERVTGAAGAVDTPIGRLPAPGALDVSGLRISCDDLAALLRVDVEGGLAELPAIRAHYEKFGARLPQALRDELSALEERLQAAAVGSGR